MNERVLLDTGPLVSLLNARDTHHKWTDGQLDSIEAPFLTCEAVLTETCFILRHNAKGLDAFRKFLSRGVVEVAFHLDGQEDAVCQLLKRYANVPMSFADACLVRMSELFDNSRVFTLDSDFRVYRRHRRNVIPLLIPPDR